MVQNQFQARFKKFKPYIEIHIHLNFKSNPFKWIEKIQSMHTYNGMYNNKGMHNQQP